MKIKTIFITLLLVSGIISSSCDIVKQAAETLNFIKCDFKLESVKNLNVVGINIQDKSSLRELNIIDAGKLAAALATNSALPLNFTLNMQARNPNTANASMPQFDWILFIDDVEMTKGIMTQPYSVPANNGIATIPLNMSVNLREALSGKSANAITNFLMNLNGVGDKPTRFMLKIKPTIYVNNFPLSYPGYIDVKTEF